MGIKLSGIASGLDTEAMVQELVASYNTRLEDYEKEKTKVEWKKEAWQALNTKVYSFYTNSLSTMRLAGNYNKKKTEVSDTTKASVIAATNAVTGTQTLAVKKLAASGYLTGAVVKAVDENGVATGEKLTANSKLSALGITSDTSIKVTDASGNETEIALKADMTISEVVTALKGAGVSASFDANNQRFFVNSKESGAAADFNITSDDTAALNALGLNKDNGAIKIDGTDAEIVLNRATFTSSSNSFSVNGLTIEVKEKTASTINAAGEEVFSTITLSTSMDVDGIYDMVKGFLKEYNELIKELDTVYNADSSRGYDPLTSEEKEAMTEDEIEKWEDKIKDSLLRRDGTVSSLISVMQTTMMSTYDVDGKKYSLASFGVNTLSYFLAGENEKGVYHIDGDKDDSATSGNSDKLKSMIATDPDAVTGFFKQLGDALYKRVNEKMQSTTLSSAFTVYNDKQIDSEITDIEKKIAKWEDYVADQEDYWYKKFSAMEKALAELQSSTSALSGLLGTA